MLHTYTDVPVSGLAHDARGQDWSAVPRALLLDWLEVFVAGGGGDRARLSGRFGA